MTDIKQNLKKLAKNQSVNMKKGIIIDGKKGKVKIKFIDDGRQDNANYSYESKYEFTVPEPELLLEFMICLLLEGKKAFGNDFTSLFNSIAEETVVETPETPETEEKAND